MNLKVGLIMNKFTLLITFIFTFIISIHIFLTKELPVSHGKDVYIGNFAYIPATVFLLFSLWALYEFLKNDK